MKILGWILFAWGVFSAAISLFGLISYPEYSKQQVPQLLFGIALIGGGYYLVNRAKVKKKEQQDKDKWNNG